MYTYGNGLLGEETAIKTKAETLETTGRERFLYKGQYGVMTNQNGLYYMWVRYYNVSIKRFLNRDTVTGNIGDSPSLNHYAYAQGNAINQNDPFGLSPDINWGAIASVLSNVAHTVLGVLGMIPGLEGMALANGILYMGEGNFRGALGSLISGFPAVGSLLGKVAKGTKFATNTSKVQKLLNVTTRLYDIGKASTDVVGNVKEMVQDYVIEKKPIDLEFGSKAIKAGLSAIAVGANIKSLSGLINGRKLGKLRGLKKAGGTEKEARKVAGGNGDGIEGNVEPKVYTSSDKYVGETATAIDKKYPGKVKAVNKVVYKADGTRLTDYDIELDNAVIQVKEGGGKGATRQAINTASSTSKEVIIYLPDQKPTSAVVKGLDKEGFKVFHTLDDLVEYVGK